MTLLAPLLHLQRMFCFVFLNQVNKVISYYLMDQTLLHYWFRSFITLLTSHYVSGLWQIYHVIGRYVIGFYTCPVIYLFILSKSFFTVLVFVKYFRMFFLLLLCFCRDPLSSSPWRILESSN